MAGKTTTRHRFTLSGPGVDKSYETAGVAISAAISRAERYGGDATFYVRDLDGATVGTVTREKGETFIARAEFIGTGRVA